MHGKTIFRKLVRGFRNLSKTKLTPPPGTRLEEPVKITGEVTVKKPEELKPYEFEGIEIPEFFVKKVTSKGIPAIEEGKLRLIYPLIPERPKKDEPILAYAKIEWNNERSRYEYIVVQPKMSQKLEKIFNKIKDLLEERLDIDFTKLKIKEAKEYLHKQFFDLIKNFGIKISSTDKKILEYYIDRDFLGLGPIEPLMYDPEIEDISCDGVNIPIFVFHRNPKIGSVVTNIVFEDKDELDSYLIRLAQLCGQSISVIDPLLNGTLPDGSRIQGTLGTDIAKKGSNFTIRKFTKYPFTPTHILNFETIDIKTLAFLWMAVDFGSSILISGGVATGKTSFLNILSLFIKPDRKIVSIEDTLEIKLPHPHWVPHVARVPIATEVGKTRGEVDLFDLLKESLRQRPEYIIVGEVRGKEAYVLFQQMATGHASLATIHSESIEKLVDRLITPPIELPPSLIESLDLVVFLTNVRYRGKFLRKLKEIYEVVGFDYENKKPITKKIIEWNADTDKFEVKMKSTILQKIMKKTGLKENEIIEEIKRRMLVLYWMKEQNITDFRDVARIINLYYNYPEQVIDTIRGEI